MINSRYTTCTGISTNGHFRRTGVNANPAIGNVDVDGEYKRHRLVQIVEDPPAQANRFNDRSE